MSKIIVSYDGTANEDDAIALGRILGDAGAEVSLAYVRHSPEADSQRGSGDARKRVQRSSATRQPGATWSQTLHAERPERARGR